MQIVETIVNAYTGYASYLWKEITQPSIHSYFYWLVAISLFFFALEVIVPWRKKQAIFRRDFWLDAFYMFFNFFLFSLIIYNAASEVVVNFFNEAVLALTGANLKELNPMYQWPFWAILLVGFIVRDFVQWWTHRLLHRVEFLWNYHKVHHSVREMGFAAHLRYHWMETIVYRTIEYLPLALLGIGLYDFFVIHIFTIAVGHYNHSNIRLSGKVTGGVVAAFFALSAWFGLADIGFLVEQTLPTKVAAVAAILLFGVYGLGRLMKYIFNSPEMHIWHHAKALPSEKRYGVNFGITLAIWDYLFGTNYIPHDGRDEELGFPNVEEFPQTFLEQIKL